MFNKKNIILFGFSNSLHYLYSLNGLYIMKFTGKIYFIDEKKDSSQREGQSFFTRTACLDTTQDVNGMLYESYVPFQATGDKCVLLDGLKIGDKIEVEAGIRGVVKKGSDKVTKSENNPECIAGFISLVLHSVKILERNGVAVTSPDVIPAPAQVEGNKDDKPW
jgi:hypothetical protein